MCCVSMQSTEEYQAFSVNTFEDQGNVVMKFVLLLLFSWSSLSPVKISSSSKSESVHHSEYQEFW